MTKRSFPPVGVLACAGLLLLSLPVPAARAAGDNTQRAVREGMALEFSLAPVEKKVRGPGVAEGDFVEVRFKVTDEATGKPVRSLRPGAWMDIDKPLEQKEKAGLDCRQKVSLYLQGIVGIRPMIDLNGYYLLLMNREPNIYVIDPFVGISGKTNLFGSVALREPGADWAKDRDERRLYVTLPKSGKVAAIAADTFKVLAEVDAGENPVRIAVQPDGALIWVGNDGKDGGEGGVTAIDAATLKAVATIPTGRGHHELAFSPDSRFAYATNRGSGTVSVIDVRERRKVKDVPAGKLPISLDYSAIAGALYVADGEGGVVYAVDGKSHEVTGKVQAKPGLGPMRFTPDGRWGLVLNSREDAVHILDASSNRVAHTVAVGKEPFQMVLSRSFAHVRCLGSERVFMVNLIELGKETPPPVTNYPVGAEAPNAVPDLGLARGIANATGESEVLVVNPANRATYFYMEGMNAPSGTFQSFGQNPLGVDTVNRGLRETEPGVYTTRLRMPVSGVYDVAFFLDSPKIVQCFSASVEADPAAPKGPAYGLEFLGKDREVPAGDNVAVRFRLTDMRTGKGLSGVKDVTVIYFRTPSYDRRQTLARELGDGEYEVGLKLPVPGAYYVYVTVPSMRIGFQYFVHLSLMAKGKEAAPPGAVPGEKGTKEPK